MHYHRATNARRVHKLIEEKHPKRYLDNKVCLSVIHRKVAPLSLVQPFHGAETALSSDEESASPL